MQLFGSSSSLSCSSNSAFSFVKRSVKSKSSSLSSSLSTQYQGYSQLRFRPLAETLKSHPTPYTLHPTLLSATSYLKIYNLLNIRSKICKHTLTLAKIPNSLRFYYPPIFINERFINSFVSSKSILFFIVNSKSPVPKCPIFLTSLA